MKLIATVHFSKLWAQTGAGGKIGRWTKEFLILQGMWTRNMKQTINEWNPKADLGPCSKHLSLGLEDRALSEWWLMVRSVLFAACSTFRNECWFYCNCNENQSRGGKEKQFGRESEGFITSSLKNHGEMGRCGKALDPQPIQLLNSESCVYNIPVLKCLHIYNSKNFFL